MQTISREGGGEDIVHQIDPSLPSGTRVDFATSDNEGAQVVGMGEDPAGKVSGVTEGFTMGGSTAAVGHEHQQGAAGQHGQGLGENAAVARTQEPHFEVTKQNPLGVAPAPHGGELSQASLYNKLICFRRFDSRTGPSHGPSDDW